MLYQSAKVRLVKISWLTFYLLGAGITLISSPQPSLQLSPYQLGQLFGVLTLTGLVVQLWLSSRARFLESGVGLNQLMRWHAINARFVFVFALLHPILLYWNSLVSGGSVFKIIRFWTSDYWLGATALVLTLVTIGLAVSNQKLKLNYESWKLVHKVGYLIIVFGFLHSFKLGSGIIARRPLFYWWLVLAALTFLAVIYRYGFRPWRRSHQWFRVTKINQETANVRTIFLKRINKDPVYGRVFQHAAGQFAFVTFHSPDLPQEEHPFTISSPPGSNHLSFTIKDSGDFTSQLSKIAKGDRVKIEGPFGVLSNKGIKGPFVFIAGGIGITPTISMLRAAQTTGRLDNHLLIYANQTVKEIVFQRELDQLAKDYGLRVVYTLSQEKAKGFFQGRITKELLAKELAGLKNPTFFIVGPPSMIAAAEKALKALGIPSNKILTEKFSLI